MTDREVLPFKDAIRLGVDELTKDNCLPAGFVDALQVGHNVGLLEEGSSGWGITHTPGRLQPYAVWYRGKIQRFCETLPEAEKRLRAATGGFV